MKRYDDYKARLTVALADDESDSKVESKILQFKWRDDEVQFSKVGRYSDPANWARFDNWDDTINDKSYKIPSAIQKGEDTYYYAGAQYKSYKNWQDCGNREFEFDKWRNGWKDYDSNEIRLLYVKEQEPVDVQGCIEISNWTRSKEEYGRETQWVPKNEWTWNNVKNIGHSESEKVWDSVTHDQYYTGYTKGAKTKHTGATWKLHEGKGEEMRRFQGEFSLKDVDLSDTLINISTTAGDDRLYINDDIYIFVYPKGMELSDNPWSPNYFMNYLALWTGTLNQGKDPVSFHGREGTTAINPDPDKGSHHGDKDKTEAGRLTDQWYCLPPTDSIGQVLQRHQDKTEWIIDVFAGDYAAGGGMYQPILVCTEAEYKPPFEVKDDAFKINQTEPVDLIHGAVSLESKIGIFSNDYYGLKDKDDWNNWVYRNPSHFELTKDTVDEYLISDNNNGTYTIYTADGPVGTLTVTDDTGLTFQWALGYQGTEAKFEYQATATIDGKPYTSKNTATVTITRDEEAIPVSPITVTYYVQNPNGTYSQISTDTIDGKTGTTFTVGTTEQAKVRLDRAGIVDEETYGKFFAEEAQAFYANASSVEKPSGVPLKKGVHTVRENTLRFINVYLDRKMFTVTVYDKYGTDEAAEREDEKQIVQAGAKIEEISAQNSETYMFAGVNFDPADAGLTANGDTVTGTPTRDVKVIFYYVAGIGNKPYTVEYYLDGESLPELGYTGWKTSLNSVQDKTGDLENKTEVAEYGVTVKVKDDTEWQQTDHWWKDAYPVGSNTVFQVYYVSRYSVKAEVAEGQGEVAVSKAIVDKDNDSAVTITPAEGWKISSVTVNGKDMTTAVEDNKLELTNIQENKEVVVKFVEDSSQPSKDFTVTYHANNSAENEETYTVQNVSGQHVVEAGTRFTTPGYKFVEWTYDEAGKKPAPAQIMVERDVNLYAQWSATVTFLVENGTFKDETAPILEEYTNPAKDTIQFPSGTPNEGYKLDGWYNYSTDEKLESLEDVKPSDGAMYILKFVPGDSGESELALSKDLTDIQEEKDDQWVSTGSLENPKPGDKLVYTITLTNTGVKARENLKLSDILTVGGVKVDTKEVTLQGPEGVDPENFTLAAGQTYTFTAEYVVKPDDAGKKIINTAAVGDTDGEEPEKEVPTTPVTPVDPTDPAQGLDVSKKQEIQKNGDHDSLRVGDTIQYTITVKNNGTTPLMDVKVYDQMFAKAADGILLDGTYQMTLEEAGEGEDVKYYVQLDVAAGAEHKITYSYVVTDDDKGKKIQNTVVAEGENGKDDDTTITDEEVEEKVPVKLFINVETLNEKKDAVEGMRLLYENGQEVCVDIGAGEAYPGDTILKADFEKALSQAAEKLNELMPNQYNVDSCRLVNFTSWEDGEFKIPDSYQVSESGDVFFALYDLNRFAVTYKVGNADQGQIGKSTETELGSDDVAYTGLPYGANVVAWINNPAHADDCGWKIRTGGKDGYTFYSWTVAPEGLDAGLNFNITDNVTLTANWSDNSSGETTIPLQIEFYRTGETTPFATLTDRSVKKADPTYTLTDADLANIPDGYSFEKAALGEDETTDKAHSFTLTGTTADENTIKVYCKPWDLAVWHVYGDTRIFDAEQSREILDGTVTVNSDTGIFDLSRIRWSDTTTTKNGVEQTDMDGSSVEIPFDAAAAEHGDYVVTFDYYRRSSSGGGGGGSTTIDDPDTPLAGLDDSDHFNYVFGYPDGTIRPTANITREEVTSIFYRLLDDTSRSLYFTTAGEFNDVSVDRWSNKAIATMANADIVSGYPGGKFLPANNITRAEFAVIVSKFDDLDTDVENKFTDVDGHWAKDYINSAANKGWISGYEDGTFRPDQYITRAEAMSLINRVLNRRVDEDGMKDILDDVKQWPDNRETAWYYYDVLEATNYHEYDEREDPTTDDETWNKILPDKTWDEAAD